MVLFMFYINYLEFFKIQRQLLLHVLKKTYLNYHRIVKDCLNQFIFLVQENIITITKIVTNSYNSYKKMLTGWSKHVAYTMSRLNILVIYNFIKRRQNNRFTSQPMRQQVMYEGTFIFYLKSVINALSRFDYPAYLHMFKYLFTRRITLNTAMVKKFTN